MRASRIASPSSYATTGLRSISAISGCAAAIPETVSSNRNDRVDIDSGLAAHARAESARRAARASIASASRPPIGASRQRGILHHLDQHSAEPHHHHRAEALVAKRPGDQLDARSSPSAARRRPRTAHRGLWRRDLREFARTRRAPRLHRRHSARRRRRRSCDSHPATAPSAPPETRFATPPAPLRRPSRGIRHDDRQARANAGFACSRFP